MTQENFPVTHEWMERRRLRLETEIAEHNAAKAAKHDAEEAAWIQKAEREHRPPEPDVAEQIFQQLRTLALIHYAHTYPMMQPRVQNMIENRLGL